jgi:hypothetical protein
MSMTSGSAAIKAAVAGRDSRRGSNQGSRDRTMSMSDHGPAGLSSTVGVYGRTALR